MSRKIKTDLVPFTNNTLGMSLTLQVPPTCAAIDQAYGEPIAHQAAIRYLLYHSFNKAFGENLIEVLMERTSHPRDAVLNKDGTPKTQKSKVDGVVTETQVLVTPQVYINQLFEKNLITEDELATIGQQVADEMDWSPKKGESRAKPAKVLVDAARRLMASVNAKAFKPETFIAQWEAQNGRSFNSIGDGTFSEENIAMALKINEDRKKAKDPLAEFKGGEEEEA